MHCNRAGTVQLSVSTPAGSLKAEKQACIDTIKQLTMEKVHRHTYVLTCNIYGTPIIGISHV